MTVADVCLEGCFCFSLARNVGSLFQRHELPGRVAPFPHSIGTLVTLGIQHVNY